jgi:hypothetical protein
VQLSSKEKLRLLVYYLLSKFQDISGSLVSPDTINELEEALNSIDEREAEEYLKRIKECLEELRNILV